MAPSSASDLIDQFSRSLELVTANRGVNVQRVFSEDYIDSFLCTHKVFPNAFEQQNNDRGSWENHLTAHVSLMHDWQLFLSTHEATLGEARLINHGPDGDARYTMEVPVICVRLDVGSNDLPTMKPKLMTITMSTNSMKGPCFNKSKDIDILMQNILGEDVLRAKESYLIAIGRLQDYQCLLAVNESNSFVHYVMNVVDLYYHEVSPASQFGKKHRYAAVLPFKAEGDTGRTRNWTKSRKILSSPVYRMLFVDSELMKSELLVATYGQGELRRGAQLVTHQSIKSGAKESTSVNTIPKETTTTAAEGMERDQGEYPVKNLHEANPEQETSTGRKRNRPFAIEHEPNEHSDTEIRRYNPPYGYEAGEKRLYYTTHSASQHPNTLHEYPDVVARQMELANLICECWALLRKLEDMLRMCQPNRE